MSSKGRGVRIGLRDLHYAILKKDDPEADNSKLEYEEPKRIIGAITANVNPNASTETLFADDGPMETATTLGEVELEMTATDIPLDIQAKLLGHSFDEDTGELLRRSDDTPPWVAVGFRSLKSDGTYRYVWLVKGKFQVPEQAHETRGDSIDFQTPSITGSFVKRDTDDTYQIDGDEAFDEFDPTDWFKKAKLENDRTPEENGEAESLSKKDAKVANKNTVKDNTKK